MKIIEVRRNLFTTFYFKNNVKNKPFTGSEISKSGDFSIFLIGLKVAKYPITKKKEISIWVRFLFFGFRIEIICQ